MEPEGFTQKEMLVMIMNKLEKMEEKLSETHEKACATNGKVKLHTKILMGLGGTIIGLIGWFFSYLIR